MFASSKLPTHSYVHMKRASYHSLTLVAGNWCHLPRWASSFPEGFFLCAGKFYTFFFCFGSFCETGCGGLKDPQGPLPQYVGSGRPSAVLQKCNITVMLRLCKHRALLPIPSFSCFGVSPVYPFQNHYGVTGSRLVWVFDESQARCC